MTATDERTDLDLALTQARERYVSARPVGARMHDEAREVMPGGNTRTELYHRLLAHVGSVRQGRDLEVVTTEVLLQQHPQLRVVIDHQNTASLRVLCAHGWRQR